jgi:hypothetical protein
VSFTLAFVLQLRKKHGKTSVLDICKLLEVKQHMYFSIKEKPLVYVFQDIKDVLSLWSDHDLKHFFTEFLEHCDQQA